MIKLKMFNSNSLKNKNCIFENNICNNCCKCFLCELDPKKSCDNCAECIKINNNNDFFNNAVMNKKYIGY